jgi:hypothetical protein
MEAEYSSRYPPRAAELELEPLLHQTGVKVRFKSDLPSYGNRIKSGQEGVVLRAQPGSVTPPVFVRWSHKGTEEYWGNSFTSPHLPFTGTYWVHWEMLELVEPREVVQRQQAQERHLFGNMPSGTQVRMRRDFEEVGRGFGGEYILFDLNAWPQVKVRWSTPGEIDGHSFIYFVHAMDIEVVRLDSKTCGTEESGCHE